MLEIKDSVMKFLEGISVFFIMLVFFVFVITTIFVRINYENISKKMHSWLPSSGSLPGQRRVSENNFF
jgi:hypothetical protein